MADVPDARRQAVYDRDDRVCAACGATEGLTLQHRQAVGMGGIDIGNRANNFQNLLTLCGEHNNRCEYDLQDVALGMGWKVPKMLTPEAGPGIEGMNPDIVPVRFSDGRWAHLTADGRLFWRPNVEARDQMVFVYGRSSYLRWAAAAKAWLMGGRK